jgi:hypothetical protein
MMCAPVETGLGRNSIDGIGHTTSRNDLKVALRQADRQQNAIRKTKTWHSERTAFEPPQPQAVPKEKGVRHALRRKLKKTTSPRPPTAISSQAPSLFRSDSFDYGDELKRRSTQVHFTAALHPRDAQSEAKTQLLNLKAQHKRRRAEQKAAEKWTKEQEKAQRRALAHQVKQEKLLEYVRALTSRHPRQNLKRIRLGPAPLEQQYVPPPRNYGQPSVPTKSWYGNTSTLVHDLVSPIASPAPQDPISRQRYSYPPAIVPHWSDFSSKDELLAHLGGGQEQQKAPYHIPQELPAYERLSVSQQNVEPVEVSTDLPDRELQMCRTKPNLVYCDICSATVSLSGVFYSCTICGPREGGIVCSGCHHENRKCNGGLHDLESSMQVVQRVSPASTWRPDKPRAKVADAHTKTSEPSEDSAALSRINADTASHSLCLATMQKKMTKVEAGIETQSKTTERLASWLEEAMERQREHAADLTKSMLDEFRTERSMHMSMIKRLSTKRKPRRQSSEGSNQLVSMSRDAFRERELALREREFTLREREMTLQERREAAKERTEKSTSSLSLLPSQSLASAPSQENRLLLGISNKLDRIEGLSAVSSHQVAGLDEKIVERVVERAMCQLSLVTSGLREHATKRKADSTGNSSSIQSTPTTGLSTMSFLQPPARNMSRGNQENDEDDGHSPKRPKNQPNPVPESGKNTLLLACPYSKFHFERYSHKNATELNYRGCSSCVLSDISRLKQHLYRVHQYPEFHCPRCFEDLINKEQLNKHLRDGCKPRDCPYPEKFSDSTKLKKKWPRQPIADSWYKVFKILFPGHRLPASPYAEDLATSGMAVGVPTTPPQPLPTLSLSPDVISDVVRRQLERRLITDPNQHAFLLSLVQDATTEALGLISASPTPITNSNPSSAVLQSGTYAASPGPDIDPTLLSAGTGTMNSATGTFQNLQDFSSVGSGVNGGASLSSPSPTGPVMSSNQSSGTFSGLSPLSGAENLMDSDDDQVHLNFNEIMAPIKPSNSTRTVDSGYGSMLKNDGVLDFYCPLGEEGLGTSGSSGSGNRSADSLIDPETLARLVREHGEDVAMPFDWSLEIGSGFGGDVFGQA